MLTSRKLETKPVARGREKEGERGGEKGRTRIRDRYRLWRTIAKVFADGWHAECEHGAKCTHHDGVEEHWGLVRLTLLCGVVKSKQEPHNRQTRPQGNEEAQTYEVAIGVAEWRDDGRHCFLCFETSLL